MKEKIRNSIEICIESAQYLLDEFYTILALLEENTNKCTENNGNSGKIYHIYGEKGGKKSDTDFRLEQECIQKNDISNTCDNGAQI